MAPGRAAQVGLWLLPVYGILLGLSTLTHQPPISDFDAYARYITTGVFLASHLGASILVRRSLSWVSLLSLPTSLLVVPLDSP